MTQSTRTVQKETLYIAVFVALVTGFVMGVAFAVYKLDSTPAAPQKAANTSHEHDNLTQDQVTLLRKLEATLKADPDNIQSWIQLGHLYFDTGDARKAIEAYSQSLKLHAGNADLYTDLGVMYRRTKQFDKAVEMFDKAISLDNKHEPSRLNKGIVFMYDFGKTDEALKVWEELLTVNPEAKAANGESVAEFIEHVKKDLMDNAKNKKE